VDLDRTAVVRRRMHEQGLAGQGFGTPAQAVGYLGAVQAQEFGEAKWALAERVRDGTEAEVEGAFARGEIVRTHILRPTWHFVAATDLRWMLALSAPRVHQANRYVYSQVGLDDDLAALCHEVMAAALADGEPRTRTELAGALSATGVEDAEGVRLAYIVMHAELEGLICSGPRRGKQHTYALVSDRAPAGIELFGDEALAELTRRYFVSHGPATVKDFSWWSGLTVAQVREGLELVSGELSCEEDEDGTPWYAGPSPAPDAGPAGCHLLSTYDELGVAYKDLRMVLRGQPPSDGLIERPVLIDGECVGSWRRTVERDSTTIQATMFASLSAPEREEVDDAAARFGASLELVSPGG
jgi:hypothetical protein